MKNYQQSLSKKHLHLTPYLSKQIDKYPSIAKQYLPNPRELSATGSSKPFQGIIKTGIPGLERMYLDRVALLFTSQCFAYCRFCFRKNYDPKQDYCNPQKSFSDTIKYLKKDNRIKEVLITGGDPLLFPQELIKLIKQLKKTPHLTSIRIGTRIFTADPQKITKKIISEFKRLNKEKSSNSPLPTPISIATHFNHLDELTAEAIKALLLCTQNYIPVYNQTVLLKEINDDPELLISLFRKLRQLGVEPYRVYHCDPVQGAAHFRTSLDNFMSIKRQLRAQVSGRIVPSFIVDTRIGKVELGADSEIVKKKKNIVFIKTPFTANIYQSMDPQWDLPEYCSLAKDGRIIVSYEDSKT